MKPVIVSTQVQYDEARKLYRDTLNKCRFDIDTGKGMEIVEEVDYLIYNYLCRDIPKEDTENSLSRFYFDQSKAEEITGYFLTHRPRDLYDIERGLNILNLRADGETNIPTPLIHIKNSREKMNVSYPVEAFGESEVEAFGHAKVIAHDKTRITAHDRVLVTVLDTAQVAAWDRSHITARNNSRVFLYNNSTVMAYNHSSVTAKDNTKSEIFDNASAEVSDNAAADAYDHALVTVKDKASVLSFHDSTINAFDNTHVTAKDESNIFARSSATIHAEGNTVVVAADMTKIIAKHHTLVFTGNDAVCEYTDKAQVINSSQNKPRFLETNILNILDHPFVKGEPVIAVNLLLASSDPHDNEDFIRQLKKMGCIDPVSTNRIVKSFKDKIVRTRRNGRNQNQSWER